MGIAALVLALLALLLAVLPLVTTQLIAAVLAVVALVLGFWARRLARREGRSTVSSTLALASGALALIIAVAIYALLIHSAHRFGGKVVPRLGRDLVRGSQKGGDRLRRAAEPLLKRSAPEPDQKRPR